jgi:hypothetical protein
MSNSRNRLLFIDLDVAKGKGRFGGIVYHVDSDLSYIKPGEKMTPLLC